MNKVFSKIKDKEALPEWENCDTRLMTEAHKGNKTSKYQQDRFDFMLHEISSKISFKGTPARVVKNHRKLMNDLRCILVPNPLKQGG
jgi:hypothetical protein